MSTAKVLSTIFTAAVLPFVNTSTGGSEGQVKENLNSALVKKANEPKVAEASQAVLPKLFQLHDFNGNGQIDVPEEAIEFHADRATFNSKSVDFLHRLFDENISRMEMANVIKWYRDAGNLKDTSPAEKEVFLDVAARLHQYMQGKDSIPTPLPRIFAEFDANNNGKLDVEEAFKFYEAVTKTKLERDNKGQVTPNSFRKVIEAFEDAKKLNITTYLAERESSSLISRLLLTTEYEKLYGPYTTADSSNLVIRD